MGQLLVRQAFSSKVTRELTPAEAELHDAYYQRGWALARNHLIYHDGEPVPVDYLCREHLDLAIECFRKALVIAPDNFATKWTLGKIYETLGDPVTSLRWFEEAWTLAPGQLDACREAGLAAMTCGEFSKALDYCDKAIAVSPNDAGLYCNRTLALMFLGRDAEAIASITRSLEIDPSDQTTQRVGALVKSVAGGSRPRPTDVQQL